MRAERVFRVQSYGRGEATGPLARRVPGARRRARARGRGPAPPPAARRGGSRHACRRPVSEGAEGGAVAARPQNWTNGPRAAAHLRRWGHAPEATGQSAASRRAPRDDLHPSAPRGVAECLPVLVASCSSLLRLTGSLQPGLFAAALRTTRGAGSGLPSPTSWVAVCRLPGLPWGTQPSWRSSLCHSHVRSVNRGS